MDKLQHRQGFTLIELVITLAMTMAAIAMAAPSIAGYVQRQELKLGAADLTSYIQSARSLSASTECPTRVELRNQDGRLQVETLIDKHTQFKGCPRWFDANSAGNLSALLVSSTTVQSIAVDRAVTLRFQGVSGALDSSSAIQFTVNKGDARARISLDGIGNGVISYVN